MNRQNYSSRCDGVDYFQGAEKVAVLGHCSVIYS